MPILIAPNGAPSANARAFYPGIVSHRFYESWDFYTEKLGFRTVCEWNVYVHLRHPCGAQLGILKEETDGQPAELITRSDGRGMWLNLDVADADAEHDRLRNDGVEIALPLEDKPWGDRQFAVRDPNGLLVFIAHRVHQPEQAPEELLATP
jgi:catechol 2,3-dioxygenase-like lactoylglutathione lyase family enzyme